MLSLGHMRRHAWDAWSRQTWDKHIGMHGISNHGQACMAAWDVFTPANEKDERGDAPPPE